MVFDSDDEETDPRPSEVGRYQFANQTFLFNVCSNIACLILLINLNLRAMRYIVNV